MGNSTSSPKEEAPAAHPAPIGVPGSEAGAAEGGSGADGAGAAAAAAASSAQLSPVATSPGPRFHDLFEFDERKDIIGGLLYV